MQAPRLILGIGELLWDILPAEAAPGGVPVPDFAPGEHTRSSAAQPLPPAPARKGLLGGAPANFSVMAGRLGNHAVLLSRVGHDELGRMAMQKLDTTPVDISVVEIDREHETGRVTVDFVQGEPSYVIHQPAAWDFLAPSADWVQLAERADAICFGTLAQRSPVSRQTIQTLVAQTSARCVRVLDVNLRPPFLSGEVMQESLELATVVKLNQDELPRVLEMMGIPASEGAAGNPLAARARQILREFPGVKLVAITRGSQGSLLVERDQWDDHPGCPVQAADGIGAGDAFTAALTHYMLRGASLSRLNEAGNRWGSWVASQPGAMPELPEAVRSQMAATLER